MVTRYPASIFLSKLFARTIGRKRGAIPSKFDFLWDNLSMTLASNTLRSALQFDIQHLIALNVELDKKDFQQAHFLPEYLPNGWWGWHWHAEVLRRQVSHNLFHPGIQSQQRE